MDQIIVNNDCFHQRESAVIVFERVADLGISSVYKRTPDNVRQYAYDSLTTAHKWAARREAVGVNKARRQFFKTRKAATQCAERWSK